VSAERPVVEAFIRRLVPADLAGRRWFGAKGREIAATRLAEAFELTDCHLLAIVDVDLGGGGRERYVLPLITSAEGLREASEEDGTWRALAVAIAGGRTIPSMPRSDRAAPSSPGPVTAALVCRPAGYLTRAAPDSAVESLERVRERPLGVDQSNTSVVLGERLLLKGFRRLETGLNPDLEVTAFLSEEVGFTAVPAVAGYAELVSADGASTIAMLQEFVAGGDDGYEATAERLTAWLLAPGEVTVEFATEEVAQLGALTADLHAALAMAQVADFKPRPATRDELRGWWQAARSQLDRALEMVGGEPGKTLRTMAPAIADELTVLRALPVAPLLTRVHGDYHLAQIVRTSDRMVIVDFEGEPTRTLEDRRRLMTPMRDVASMLRSIDHAGRSARHRAEARAGAPLARTGLDLPGWLRRARARFLEAYAARLQEHASPVVVDPDLLRALEIEKETYEFVYAAAYLPDWMWAPIEGMRGLLEMS
jgi:maltose alpha-D-glucosyltransferase / alpha-amylase